MTTPKAKFAGLALIAALCVGFTLGLTAPAWAGFDEGVAALKRGDYATAIRELRPLAEQGNAYAQFNLGNMYYNGLGVPQDHAEAVKWYRKAADQGDANAQYNLGSMYEKGQGVPQDYAQAHMWYNLAASKFSPGEKRDEAVNNRDIVAKRMTRAQISEAQKLAREWGRSRGSRVMVNWVDQAQLAVAVGVVLVELGALVASVSAVWQARKTAHANMVSVFLEEYGSQRMHDDLWALGEFRDKNPKVIDPLRRLVTDADDLDEDDKKYVQTYIKMTTSDKMTTSAWPKVDPARRHVYNFYKRAWRLHENGYLGKKALSIIADTNGVKILFELAHPLTRATLLNIVHKGKLQEFQRDLTRFGWLKDFGEFVKKNLPPESDMKD